MLEKNGVGIKKYENYGLKFLNAINEYILQNNIDIEVLKNNNKLNSKNNEDLSRMLKKESTYKITYDMFNSGKNIEKIAIERNLTISTVQGHFMKFLEEQWDNADKIEKYLYDTQVNKQYIEDIKLSCKKNGIKSFGKIKKSLPEEVSYFDIRYVVWKYMKKE